MKTKTMLFSIFVAAMLLMGLTTFAGATVLSFTDTQFGNEITYSLDYNLISGTKYDATFTVSVIGTGLPVDYAGWFAFKESEGNNQAAITNLTFSDGSWIVKDINNPDPQVLQGQNNLASFGGNFSSGFFADTFDTLAPNTANALLVTSPDLFTFDFNFDTGVAARTDEIPFQVGYYTEKDGEVTFNGRLSENLNHNVPEPGMLMLFGTGLLGLGLFGRKKFGK